MCIFLCNFFFSSFLFPWIYVTNAGKIYTISVFDIKDKFSRCIWKTNSGSPLVELYDFWVLHFVVRSRRKRITSIPLYFDLWWKTWNWHSHVFSKPLRLKSLSHSIEVRGTNFNISPLVLLPTFSFDRL